MLKHSTAGTHNKDIKAEQTNEQTVQKSLWESLRKDMEVLRYRLWRGFNYELIQPALNGSTINFFYKTYTDDRKIKRDMDSHYGFAVEVKLTTSNLTFVLQGWRPV
jgi:hypothetical protein